MSTENIKVDTDYRDQKKIKKIRFKTKHFFSETQMLSSSIFTFIEALAM